MKQVRYTEFYNYLAGTGVIFKEHILVKESEYAYYIDADGSYVAFIKHNMDTHKDTYYIKEDK